MKLIFVITIAILSAGNLIAQDTLNHSPNISLHPYSVSAAMQFNSQGNDIPLSIYSNLLYFSSDRKSARKMTPGKDYNFYAANLISGMSGELTKMIGKYNSADHEIALEVQKDGLVFSRSGSLKNNLIPEKKSRSWFADAPGKVAKEIWFSGNAYPVSHVTLSPDGNAMLFASDKSGGSGGYDLYVSLKSSGGWQSPTNLGPEVNSPYHEIYPSFDLSGNIYFSSDRPGNKGFDVYYYAPTGTFFMPSFSVKPFSPLNTEADDVSVIWDRTNQNGFYAVRNGAFNDFDVSQFRMNYKLDIQIFESGSNRAIPTCAFQVTDESNKSFSSGTNANGEFTVYLKRKQMFSVVVNKQGYKPYREFITVPDSLAAKGRIHRVYLVSDTTAVVVAPPVPVPVVVAIPPVDSAIVFSGKALEAGKPVAGAVILIYSGSPQPIAHASSDSLGYFSAALPAAGQYTAVCRTDHLRPHTVQFTHTGQGKAERDFHLTRGDYILIQGTVMNIQSGAGIEGVMIRVIDNRTQNKVDSLRSSSNGHFWLMLPMETVSNYSVIASHNGFFSSRQDVIRKDSSEKDIVLGLKLPEYGLDKVVKTIYFDYNKSSLRLLSQMDINELRYFLLENPGTTLEAGAHTDARGGADYNLTLSRQRAQEVVTFLSTHDEVPADRITPRGYGETRLINKCADGVICTEAEHQLNRRAEFKVVKIEPLQ